MIEIKNLSKTFNKSTPQEFTALKNVNLTIKDGEFCILKGASGSGKSTLLSLIAGLFKPSEGEIIINNESITKLSLKFASSFRRKNIGFIFQSFNLLPNLSAIDNVLLPTLPDKIDKKEEALKLLQDFEILNKKDCLCANLSGGEKQRVAIARALINNPNIILADEPSASLDFRLTNELISILKNLKNQNKTIILATHDNALLEANLQDQIYEMQKC